MHTIYITNNDMFVKGEVLTGKEMLLFSDMTNTQNRTGNGTMHGMGKFHRKAVFYQCSLVSLVQTLILYSMKVWRGKFDELTFFNI